MEPSYVDKVISSRVLLLFRVGYTDLNIFAIPCMSHRFFFMRILFIRITSLKIAKNKEYLKNHAQSLMLIRI